MEVEVLKATVLGCAIGVVGFGEENQIVEKVLFPKDPVKAAEKILEIGSGKAVDEVITLIRRLLERGYDQFVFENSGLARSTRERLKIRTETVRPSEAGELLRERMEELAVDLGFVERPGELRLWLHRVSTELTKMRVRQAVEKRDLMVVQAILTIDDLDKTANLFMGRIREWYGLHFPELSRLVEKHETYAKLVLNFGSRGSITREKLEELGMPKEKAKRIVKAAQTSMGAELSDVDIAQIQSMCRITLELYEARRSLERYVDETMEEVAPNVKALVGSLLGARLIALAGGLQNLAKKPASTIQVLGAEKALFRALRTGTRPPKHGIIFQHTSLRDSKRWQRGKIARALAGKLAIAARIDAYGGKNIGQKLREETERRIKEIQEKYEEPPKKPLPKRRAKRRKRRGRS